MGKSIVLPDGRLNGTPWARSFDRWIEWLSRQRNDLEMPAIDAFPVIGEVLDELRDMEGCRLARMSGSGATCFAIVEEDHLGLASDLQARHPDWWIEAAQEYPCYFDQSLTKGFSMDTWPDLS